MSGKGHMREVAYLHKVFDEADRNSDGRITIKEVVETLYVIGYGCTEQDVDEMCSLYENTIDFPDFLKILYGRIKVTDNSEMLRKAFQEFDEKKNGRINVANLKETIQMMKNFDEGEVEEMIKEMKPDANGMVNYEAFIRTMQKRKT